MFALLIESNFFSSTPTHTVAGRPFCSAYFPLMCHAFIINFESSDSERVRVSFAAANGLCWREAETGLFVEVDGRVG